MINFLLSYAYGGYTVYCNWKPKGHMVAYEETGTFKVYRYLEDGTEVYMGLMSMWEARNMFSALYL